MMERYILSSKGVYKGLPNLSSLDLVHDASTFRPPASESEKVELSNRSYTLTTDVIPVAGILRVVNEGKGEVEDYLVVYPFGELKPNVNLIGLGKKKLAGEENLDDRMEYEERIQLEGESLDDITIGGGVSGAELKRAWRELVQNKEDYPELYEFMKMIVSDEENPDPLELRAGFAKYAQQGNIQKKEVRSLGIKNVDDLDTGFPLGYVWNELVSNKLRGVVELGDLKATFIPTNLIETGVAIEQGTKRAYEFISFAPELIKLESGRAVAQRINAVDEFYTLKAYLLKLLNKNRLKALRNGNEEVKQKVLESLEKAIEHEANNERKRALLEKVKSLVEKGDYDRLEKALKKMYVENRQNFIKAMLEKPIVNKDAILKELNGKYFISTPLSSRGYSLRFAKELFEKSAYEEGKGKVVVGLYTNIPRLTLDENKNPKVQNIYKPIAFVVAEYGDKLEPENVEVIRSKPDYLMDKWDKRIAGAINKMSANALRQIKQEIAKDKSLAPIYVKFLDEAIRQVESGKVEGVVKEYAETITKAKEELRKLRSGLKDENTIRENLKRMIKVKDVIETKPYEELPEAIRELKRGYWNSIFVANEIEKAVFYSPKAKEEMKMKQRETEQVEPEIVDIPDFDADIKEEVEEVPDLFDYNEEEFEDDIDINDLEVPEDWNKPTQKKTNKRKL
jgi:hypothetical protein